MQRNKLLGLSLALGGAALLTVDAVSAGDDPTRPPRPEPEAMPPDIVPEDEDDTKTYTSARPKVSTETDYQALIADWGEKPREAAKAMIAKYGAPTEITESMLIWRDNGTWKRTIVHRDEVAHDFPKPHSDIVEQVIDFKVPVDKFDDLAMFDGSVVAERTNGELSARCGQEEMNYLALNLAVDIVEGEKDATTARAEYATTAATAMKALKPQKKGAKKVAMPKYAAGLQFQVPEGGTGDRDAPHESMKTRTDKKGSGGY